MILQALRANAKRQRIAEVDSVPAPMGGWNTRDGLAAMDPMDAVQLDNYIPVGDGVTLRGGSERFATITGVSAAPETLMIYSGGSTNKMLACASGGIYDCSTTGTVGSSLSSGYSNNRWSYTNMGGYIVFVNGADTPSKYDGSSVSTTSISASTLTPSNLIFVTEFKSRLFFIEKNTLKVWYLATSAISGTANKLDFSNYCSEGGKLVSIGKWTRDGGAGMDDFIVFLTDKGQALIYQGTDPSDSSKWSLVGVFKIGNPVGNNPILRMGSDLIVITNDGFVPLSKVLPLDRIGALKVAISDKIRSSVNSAVKTYGNNYGWQPIFYPKANLGIFNIPTSEGVTAAQYVVSSISNGWCQFVGLNAVCWAVFQGALYFGAPGGFVVLFDTTGYKDDTLAATQAFADIQGDIQPAFNYFKKKSTQKRFTMVRPQMKSSSDVMISQVMNTDFSDLATTVVATNPASGTPWSSAWGSPWSPASALRKNWISTEGVGYCGSLHLRTATQGVSISLNSIDYAFENGGVI